MTIIEIMQSFLLRKTFTGACNLQLAIIRDTTRSLQRHKIRRDSPSSPHKWLRFIIRTYSRDEATSLLQIDRFSTSPRQRAMQQRSRRFASTSQAGARLRQKRARSQDRSRQVSSGVLLAAAVAVVLQLPIPPIIEFIRNRKELPRSGAMIPRWRAKLAGN